MQTNAPIPATLIPGSSTSSATSNSTPTTISATINHISLFLSDFIPGGKFFSKVRIFWKPAKEPVENKVKNKCLPFFTGEGIVFRGRGTGR